MNNFEIIYKKALEFKNKYPMTVAWRIKKHCKIVSQFINPNEEIKYVFLAQKNDNPLDIVTTYVVVITSERLILATKRLIFGYLYTTITPDLFNDLNIKMGIVWGKVYIDTVKETVLLSNIQREALPEIETNVTHYMMEAKKKYNSDNN